MYKRIDTRSLLAASNYSIYYSMWLAYIHWYTHVKVHTICVWMNRGCGGALCCIWLFCSSMHTRLMNYVYLHRCIEALEKFVCCVILLVDFDQNKMYFCRFYSSPFSWWASVYCNPESSKNTKTLDRDGCQYGLVISFHHNHSLHCYGSVSCSIPRVDMWVTKVSFTFKFATQSVSRAIYTHTHTHA